MILACVGYRSLILKLQQQIVSSSADACGTHIPTDIGIVPEQEHPKAFDIVRQKVLQPKLLFASVARSPSLHAE